MTAWTPTQRPGLYTVQEWPLLGSKLIGQVENLTPWQVRDECERIAIAGNAARVHAHDRDWCMNSHPLHGCRQGTFSEAGVFLIR